MPTGHVPPVWETGLVGVWPARQPGDGGRPEVQAVSVPAGSVAGGATVRRSQEDLGVAAPGHRSAQALPDLPLERGKGVLGVGDDGVFRRSGAAVGMDGAERQLTP